MFLECFYVKKHIFNKKVKQKTSFNKILPRFIWFGRQNEQFRSTIFPYIRPCSDKMKMKVGLLTEILCLTHIFHLIFTVIKQKINSYKILLQNTLSDISPQTPHSTRDT